MRQLFFYIILPILLIIPFEVMTYLLHKHVMHGFGWGWHKSHHEHPGGGIEKNDYYAICFAGIAIFLFYLSNIVFQSYWLFSFSLGLTLYGACYFFMHDFLIHRRIPNSLFKKIKNTYIKRLIRAHAIHHKIKEKHNTKAFGFLYAAKKYQYPTNTKSLNTQDKS